MKKGMSLVEVLVVVLILGALAAIAIPRIASSTTTANQNACDTNIAVINSAIEQYAANNDGVYPVDQAACDADVLGDTDYFPDGAPTCPTTGTYTYNAVTKRVGCDVH